MEEILYLVPHNGELPKINKTINVIGFMSDKKSNFKVKAIVGLRWNDNGDLICTLKGNYIK